MRREGSSVLNKLDYICKKADDKRKVSLLRGMYLLI